MFKLLLSCSLFCAIAAFPQLAAAQQKIKMPADSLVLTSTIDGAPAIAFVFAAMNAGGKTAICGAYYYPENSRASPFQRQQLRDAYSFRMG